MSGGIISYEKVIDTIKNIGEVIIKPIADSSSGNNVKLLNIKNGTDVISGLKIDKILQNYNKNFAIQERIKPNKYYAKLNSSSVNTIRINTYICDSKVYSAPVSMRIGRDGKIVDNAHAGGLQIGITKDGRLRKFAFSEFGEKFEKHPDTNIEFENYKIPKVQEMIDFAIKYHYRIPHMGIISWDLTLDEDENIVVIETNITCPTVWFPQYTTGESFFGENTEKMIKMLNEGENK